MNRTLFLLWAGVVAFDVLLTALLIRARKGHD